MGRNCRLGRESHATSGSSEPSSPVRAPLSLCCMEMRQASRWREGGVRPEGAVRCKGSGRGQPWAGSPSSLGCMVATEVVTGTRSPPTRPAGVVHPGVEPGHSRSLRVDPVHPGGAGSPGGYLPGRVAREASSSHQRGRPVLPVQPTRRIRRKPRGQTVRKHTHFCRSETSQFKTRMSPTSRQSHHDLLRSALLNGEEAARATHPRGLEGRSGQHSSPGPSHSPL